MRRMKVITLLIVLLSTMLANASSDDVSRGKVLIEHAQEKSNIFALPSFRMSASVRIDSFGKPLEGTYSLLWNGPDQWREEIVFPGYNEVQVGGKGVVYVQRSVDHVPYAVSQFRSSLGFVLRANPGPWAKEQIKKVRDRKIKGQRITCVEVVSGGGDTREICINPVTGLLNRAREGVDESEVQPIAGKLFPHVITFVNKDKKEVEVHISELWTGEALAASLFQVPANAVARPGCMNAVPPRQRKMADAQYLVENPATIPQGTVAAEPRGGPEQGFISPRGVVAVYALIDENGAPQNMRVTLSGGPDLDKQALDIIRKSHFEPASCQGTAVPMETIVTLNYPTAQF
jgi:hypothetical protein